MLWWPLVCAIGFPFVIAIHRQPLSTFYGEWWAAVLWGIACTLVLYRPAARETNTPQTPPTLPLVALFPLGLAAVTALQVLWLRPDQNDIARLVPLVFLLGALVVACGHRVGRGDHAMHAATMVACALLIASVLGVAAQCVQLFRAEFSFFGLVSEYFPTEQRRLWGNLNQPNHQATVHGLGLAALAYLVTIRRWSLVLSAGLAALLIFGVILTGSRTGVIHIALASLLGVLLLLACRFPGQTRGQRFVLLAFFLALMPAYFWLQPLVLEASAHFGWKLFDTVARLGQGDAGSARGALWRHAWAMFQQHPWFGVGWMEFGIEQWRQLRALGVKVELAQQAHNQLLDLLAKTGLAGVGLIGITLSLWFWRVLRVAWHATGQQRAGILLGLGWLAMLCAHSMLEYPLHYLYFFFLFCFLLGWLEPGGWTLHGRFARVGVRRGASLAFATACALGGGLVLMAVLLDYKRAEDVSRAAVFNPTEPPRPRFWFRDVAEHRQTARMPLMRANAVDALARHQRALHVLPTPTLIQRTALLTAMQGDIATAQRMVDDLQYYYWINPANERLQLARLCATLPAKERPHPYCPLP